MGTLKTILEIVGALAFLVFFGEAIAATVSLEAGNNKWVAITAAIALGVSGLCFFLSSCIIL